MTTSDPNAHFDVNDLLDGYDQNSLDGVEASHFAETRTVTGRDGKPKTYGIVNGRAHEVAQPVVGYTFEGTQAALDPSLLPSVSAPGGPRQPSSDGVSGETNEWSNFLANAGARFLKTWLARRDAGTALLKGGVKGGAQFNKTLGDVGVHSGTIADVLGAPGDLINSAWKQLFGGDDKIVGGSAELHASLNNVLGWVSEFIPFNESAKERMSEPYHNKELATFAEHISQFGVVSLPVAKTIKALTAANAFVRSLAWGAIADAAAFPEDQETILASLAKYLDGKESGDFHEGGATGEEQKEFVQFMLGILEKNADDPVLLNRGKTAYDGMLIGAGFEGLVRLIPLIAKKIPWKGVAAAIGVQQAATVDDAEAGVLSSVASKISKKEGRTRIGTTGQYIGAPPGIRSQQMLGALRNRVRSLAEEGAAGRLWYERSSKEILEAVGGDVDEADKLIQAIAVTSPGTPVKNNFDYALQAYSQWKAGVPIQTGRFPVRMSKKLEEIFNGQQWDGRKTDDFYNNLMIHIDPNRTGPVTGDIWMLRAFGFTKPNEMPSPRQYEFITKETQKIAKEFGWEPHQVQAAIWVTMKGRAENPGVKKATEASSLKKGWIKFEVNERTGKKERVVIDHENHMKNWLKHAMKHKLTKEDIKRAKFDYADAIADNSGQISWESKKGLTSNNMPELFNAPWKQQSEYHVAISKVFLDENGDDIIAKRLGILSPRDFEAPGFFEGVTSPGTQTIALMPRQFKGKSTGSIEKANNDLIAAYAAVRGILLNQDGVGWHRPFHKARKMDENGISIDIGRPFSKGETQRLGDILRELSGHKDFNPIASGDGVRLINFDFTRRVPDGKKGFKPAQADTWIDHDKLLTNKEFKKLVDNAYNKLELDDKAGAKLGYFHSYNGYSANDWKVNKNGEGYIKAISGAGRSDLQRLVRDIIREFQPKVDEVDQSFARQYGWTINDAINASYRKRLDEVVDIGKAEGGTKAKGRKGKVKPPDK